ncbi:MAG TPA: ATP-binding protein [Candidatus Acidoferrales bacterium]|nr:ATP-binding protein [Candidatus Acidoferrales bacterium]
MTTVLYKLLLSSLLIILLPVGLAILWTSKTFSTLLEKRFAESSKAQAERVRLLLAEKQEVATGIASWIAEMPGVKEKLKARDRSGMFQHLLPIVGSIELDFIEVLDRDGEIFLRVHDPSRYGDRPPLPADIRGLLRGMRDIPTYGVELRGKDAYLRAAEAIEAQGVLGVVSAGYAINGDLIERLARATGAGVSIRVAGRAYASGGAHLEAPGTLAAAEPSAGQELRWHAEPAPALEIRFPLQTSHGAEGVISLLFPAREMEAAIGVLQQTLILVAIAGSALAFLVSWLLSRRLTAPLKKLVMATELVSAGDYSQAVNVRARDEIGALAKSFNRMLEDLARSKAEVESYRQKLERKIDERGRELVENEKKREAMAYMIAHDLKNPLLGIKKTLERLNDLPADGNGEERRRILKELSSAGELVIGMINDMLDVYRSEFGELPLALSEFQLEETIETSLRVLGPELEEKGIRVSRRSEPPAISIVADRRRLTRLLINLLSNAIKFSPPNGQIRLSVSLAEGQGRTPAVLLQVQDDGEGIPAADLDRIFDRFYSRGRGNMESGTGLGLPYCKLVVEAHRGEIWAENRSAGGFLVSVLLPLDANSTQELYAS